MKVFISQPMNGKSNEEIQQTREAATHMVKALYGEDIEVIDSFAKDAPHEAKPVWYLGEAIKKMNDADLVVFVADRSGEVARGCRVERHVAEEYGIPVMEILYRKDVDAPRRAIPTCKA